MGGCEYRWRRAQFWITLPPRNAGGSDPVRGGRRERSAQHWHSPLESTAHLTRSVERHDAHSPTPPGSPCLPQPDHGPANLSRTGHTPGVDACSSTAPAGTIARVAVQASRAHRRAPRFMCGDGAREHRWSALPATCARHCCPVSIVEVFLALVLPVDLAGCVRCVRSPGWARSRARSTFSAVAFRAYRPNHHWSAHVSRAKSCRTGDHDHPAR